MESETAKQPGLCYVCGKYIYTGDSIVRAFILGQPVAAHENCARILPNFDYGEKK